MDNLLALLPASKSMWLLIIAGVTTLAFALSAIACDRLEHRIISPFLAAGAWLFGAFGVLVWFLIVPEPELEQAATLRWLICGADIASISTAPVAPVVHSDYGPKIQRNALFGAFLGDLRKRNWKII
jgi:hypothetical protein